MSKPVNKRTSSEFDRWIRGQPTRALFVDVDGWALQCAGLKDEQPRAIIELKRSHIPVEEWEPFDADRRSYNVALNFANAAGVPLLVLYYQAGEEIRDETLFALRRMTVARPSFKCSPVKLMTSRQFVESIRRFCGDVDAG